MLPLRWISHRLAPSEIFARSNHGCKYRPGLERATASLLGLAAYADGRDALASSAVGNGDRGGSLGLVKSGWEHSVGFTVEGNPVSDIGALQKLSS